MNKCKQCLKEKVSYDTFSDIYQYAFGGCNEAFLKAQYECWKKSKGCNHSFSK